MSPALAPLHFGALCTLPGLRAGAGSLGPFLRFSSLHPCTCFRTASGTALRLRAPSGPASASATFSLSPGFPLYPVNLVVAEYRKLERSRPGLSNPFVAASNKSKLLRMAIKAFPQLVPPPLTVRCPMSALGADRATLMRQTLMKGSEHGI